MTYLQLLIPFFGLVALAGLTWLRHHRGFWVAFAGVLGLLLLSWPPVDWLFSRPLEVWYPVRALPDEAAQAIVVLSGSVEPPLANRPYPLPNEETYRRCEFAAWLYHHWKPLPVLACGGAGTVDAGPYAETMRQLLERAGVPESMIWLEERSQSTHDNAVFGAEILHNRGIGKIALVVEARTMPRAAASFRRQGIQVVPAPSEFREFQSFADEALPNWKAIRRNEAVFHEIIGLAWYKMRGWI